MSMRLMWAGVILLNVLALGYLVKSRLPARPAVDKPESIIDPAKIRQLDRKQIPSLAMIAWVQRTAPESSAVRVDDRG